MRRLWCTEGRPRVQCNDNYIQYKAAKCALRRLHRYHVQQHLIAINQEIDRTPEIDKNNRKNPSDYLQGRASNSITESIEAIYYQDVTEQWVSYFIQRSLLSLRTPSI